MSWVKNDNAKINFFPGATPKKVLHYLDLILNDALYNTSILHVGVNDNSIVTQTKSMI